MRGLNIDIKWIGTSVSGLVVIAGIICILLYAGTKDVVLFQCGVLFVILGLFGAIFMTLIIKGRI